MSIHKQRGGESPTEGASTVVESAGASRLSTAPAPRPASSLRRSLALAVAFPVVAVGSFLATRAALELVPTHAVSVAQVTPDLATGAEVGALDGLLGAYRCSTTGLPHHAIPAGAIIRTPDARLHVVSFARGWAVYEHRTPGLLVAVCARHP